jgi:hypothetical protein
MRRTRRETPFLPAESTLRSFAAPASAFRLLLRRVISDYIGLKCVLGLTTS